MNVANSPVSKVAADTNRSQVLAKVYRLLLSLAEKAESNTAISDVAAAINEKSEETASVKEASPSQ
jgi:hypothetical protein